VAEAAEAGKSIQNQDRGVADKTGWEGRSQQCGTRVGADETRAEPKKTLALEYLNVCPRSQTSYPVQDKLERVANQNGNSG